MKTFIKSPAGISDKKTCLRLDDYAGYSAEDIPFKAELTAQVGPVFRPGGDRFA